MIIYGRYDSTENSFYDLGFISKFFIAHQPSVSSCQEVFNKISWPEGLRNNRSETLLPSHLWLSKTPTVRRLVEL